MTYRFEQFELDPALFELRREGTPVAAEPKVISLLHFLIANRERMVSKDDIIEEVWDGRIVSDAAISGCVKAARALLDDDGKQQRLIKTVHGKGFRFVGAVEEAGAPSDVGRVPGLMQRVEFATAKDGTSIAFSKVGSGPALLKTANWLNHLEYEWESPIWRHWIEMFARDRTLIRYDERGNGLSDWKVEDLSFEAMVDDLETVVDAAEIDEPFDLFGISQGCSVSIAYAVRHPERVRRLILHGGFALGWAKRPDEDLEQRKLMLNLAEMGWGLDNPAFRQFFTTLYYPEGNQEQMRWFNELQRVSASPKGARRLQEALGSIDVTDLLAKVETPTLVTHSRGDQAVAFSAGRYLAQNIPGARFVALESRNHIVLEDEPAWPRLRNAILDFLNETLA